MDSLIRFIIKILPFLPSKKDDKKLIYAIVYHILVFLCGGVLSFATIVISSFMMVTVVLVPVSILLIILAILFEVALLAYSVIGVIFTVCSYFGIEFLSSDHIPSSGDNVN